MAKKVVSISMSEQMHEHLKKVAEQQYMTVSAIITRLLEKEYGKR